MKFISYALATALSISTTSPVVAESCKSIVDVLAEDCGKFIVWSSQPVSRNLHSFVAFLLIKKISGRNVRLRSGRRTGM